MTRIDCDNCKKALVFPSTEDYNYDIYNNFYIISIDSTLIDNFTGKRELRKFNLCEKCWANFIATLPKKSTT